MNIEGITEWAKKKGIDLLGTGDFTHYQWLSELKAHLKEVSYGLYHYQGVHFFLTTEISCIYSQGKRVRKIHILIFAPSFQVVERINKELSKIGNLDADGRPILGLPAKDLVGIVLGISRDCFIVPAHIWTPWFSLFGANSGFDDIEECFGEYTKNIYALETGLSSDPLMNWMLSKLDRFALISNSDAHSPENLGREANVFDCKMDYKEIIESIKKKDKTKFKETIEFFPEEGKYHFDGHRNCGITFSPKEAKAHNNICPKCKRPLTIGVLHRVEDLSDRELGFKPQDAFPFRHLVPLREIIALSLNKTRTSTEVKKLYDYLVSHFGSEFQVLLKVPIEDLSKVHSRVAEGISRAREGKVKVEPGYDGVYGKVEIFEKEEGAKQMNLFQIEG
jgi:uncharacterized protein (TIGR00375 family)